MFMHCWSPNILQGKYVLKADATLPKSIEEENIYRKIAVFLVANITDNLTWEEFCSIFEVIIKFKQQFEKTVLFLYFYMQAYNYNDNIDKYL